MLMGLAPKKLLFDAEVVVAEAVRAEMKATYACGVVKRERERALAVVSQANALTRLQAL